MSATYPPPPEQIPVIPWEDPNRSIFDGLFETVKLLASSPGEAFRRMPLTGGLGRPLFYAIAVVFALVAGGLAALISSR